MSNVFYQIALEIAKHEFGHYITAKYLRFRVGEVFVDLNPGKHGGGSFIEPATALADKDEIDTYLKNRIAVLYAGVLAETLFDNKVDDVRACELLKLSGKSDHDKIRELTHVRRSIVYDYSMDKAVLKSQLQSVSDESWNIAVAIVEKGAEAIGILAHELATKVGAGKPRGEMTSAEIESHPAMIAFERDSN